MEFLKILLNLPGLGWFVERRRNVVEHDRGVFARFDEVLPERKLLATLESLGGGAFVHGAMLGSIDSYLAIASQASHDYLIPVVRRHHDLFIRALKQAMRFATPRLFPGAGDILNFLPDKNLDFFVHDPQLNAEFDREFRELNELLDVLETQYRRYRRLIHERLFV